MRVWVTAKKGKGRNRVTTREKQWNVVLNNYEPLTTWRPTLDRYLDSESKNACMSTRV